MVNYHGENFGFPGSICKPNTWGLDLIRKIEQIPKNVHYVLQRQKAKQSSPDVLLHIFILQLFLWDDEVFLGQVGYVIAIGCLGSDSGSARRNTGSTLNSFPMSKFLTQSLMVDPVTLFCLQAYLPLHHKSPGQLHHYCWYSINRVDLVFILPHSDKTRKYFNSFTWGSDSLPTWRERSTILPAFYQYQLSKLQ